MLGHALRGLGYEGAFQQILYHTKPLGLQRYIDISSEKKLKANRPLLLYSAVSSINYTSIDN